MRFFIAVVAACAITSGCVQEEGFAGNQGLHAFAMTESTPVLAEGEDTALVMVESRLEFQITAPTEEELAELGGLPAAAPYPSHPWVMRGDLHIEIDLAVTNLMDEAREVTVAINGFNEFHEYMPAFQILDEEVVADYSQWERTLIMQPHETWQRSVHEREIDEMAVDLAAVVNGAPNAQQIVHFQSQFDVDPRAQPYIPRDAAGNYFVPGLTGVRFALRASAASNIVLEASVRIRDSGDRLYDDESEDPWVLPVPAPFAPAPAEEY